MRLRGEYHPPILSQIGVDHRRFRSRRFTRTPRHTYRLRSGASAIRRIIQTPDQIHIVHLGQLKLPQHQVVNDRVLQLLEPPLI